MGGARMILVNKNNCCIFVGSLLIFVFVLRIFLLFFLVLWDYNLSLLFLLNLHRS